MSETTHGSWFDLEACTARQYGSVGAVNHCWHYHGMTPTTGPALARYHCCYCGKTKEVTQTFGDVKTGHGPYEMWAGC